MKKPFVFLFVSLAIASITIQCSSSRTGNLTMPDYSREPGLIPIENSIESSNRMILGFWEVIFDMEKNSVTTITNRELARHYNTTSMIPAPEIVINSYDPSSGIIDISVTLSNPYPINVFDVRLIIFTDETGHILLNPDDWTFLYDIPGGRPINPLKCFADEQPLRIFANGTNYTKNLLIKLPGGNPEVKFAVDASYPSNCDEPYSIYDFHHEGIYDQAGSSAEVSVKVDDWQDDVNIVKLYCPAVIGPSPLNFSYYGASVWRALLLNNAGANEGDYSGFIIAYSENSGALPLLDEVTITIERFPSGWARTWGNQFTSSNFREFGWGVTTDISENIYVTGNFMGTVDLDPGVGVDEHTSATGGTSDVFLSKFDQKGDFMWAKTWGNSNNDEGRDVAVDNAGNIYVFGVFKGTVDFDPGPAIVEHTSISENYYDNFLSKFSANGELIQVLTWEANSDTFMEFGFGVAVDTQNSVYVTSVFEDIVDLDPGPEVDEHISNNYTNIYISKFNSNGEFEWAKSWGGEFYEESKDIAICRSDNNVYITGRFSDVVDFDPGPGIDQHTALGEATGIFLSKFNPDGDFQWAETWGGQDNSRDCGRGVAGDNYGNIFITGSYGGLVDFDPGPGIDEHEAAGLQRTDIFLCKFKYDGTYQWAITWYGPGTISDFGFSVETDYLNNILITGSFSGSIDFDPGPEEDIHTTDYLDTFICKLDNYGNYKWARTWGNGWQYGQDIAVDRLGNAFAYGCYCGTVDLDPGSGEDIHTADGMSDIYLIKYLPNGYWN